MSYTVCQSDLTNDRACILDLWKQNLPDASGERYAWLYESGPATGWLVRSKDAEVVGATGLMGRTMKVFDRVLPAGQAIDLNVGRDHRTIGPALGLQRAVTAAVKQHQLGLIYTFPNARSELIQRRIGFKVLDNLGRWARPLCIGNTFKARLQHSVAGYTLEARPQHPVARYTLKARLRHTLARKVASAAWLPTLAGPLLYLKSPEAFYRRPSRLGVYVTDRFDTRFDALWQVGSRQFDVVGERTSAYLSWRFGRCPDARYRVLCLANAQDELLAYLVYHRREGMVHIGDFFFADVRDLDPLLAEFLRLMRREKAEAIITVYLGSSIVCRKLRRFGFWKRPSGRKAMLYVDREHLAADVDRVFDSESWHLTLADLDTDF